MDGMECHGRERTSEVGLKLPERALESGRQRPKEWALSAWSARERSNVPDSTALAASHAHQTAQKIGS